MDPTIRSKPTAAIWAGRILGAIVVLAMLADAGVSLFAPHLLTKNMAETGFPMALAPTIGIILLICTVLYAIPGTSVLGAVLMTGFLGGAICTHLRIGEIGSPPQLVCIAIGIATWLSLYLRYGAVRMNLPFLDRSQNHV